MAAININVEIVFLKSSEKCPNDNYFKFSATVMKTCTRYLIKLDIKWLIMSKAVKTFSYFNYVLTVFIIKVSAVRSTIISLLSL